MKTYRPVSLVWFLLGFLLLVVLASEVLAQDYRECRGNRPCNDEVVGQVAGDSTKVFSLSGSDMEINDCLATYSFLFGIWQNVKVNPLCEADKMDAQGNHQGAAEMRCSTHKYRKVYGKDCVATVIYVPPVMIEPESKVSYVDEWEDDWEEKYVAQQQEIEMVREEAASKQSSLEAKLDADARRRLAAREALKGE